MTFVSSLEQKLNTTTTANGAKAYKSTGNACVDLFGKIAASRSNITGALTLFDRAYKEHPETAVRALFWARDIRGGQGERTVFRAILPELVKHNKKLVSQLIHLVPEYGRWDDLLALENTSVWTNVLAEIKTQLLRDMGTIHTGNVSLLAKWLPSINASSKDSKRLGRKITKFMGWSERDYRKNLTQLRSAIKIVEQKMCSREWNGIDYEHLPSRAAFMYRNAFKKHDIDRYQEYLNLVSSGEAKINAGTLYPYDIVSQCLYKEASNDQTLDLQWDALPNYLENKEFNGLVVADVSSSMRNPNGVPLAVAISLAMYISERNNSPVWKDKFITFTDHPALKTVTGATIGQKVRNLARSAWGYNTNLMAVFRLILETAKENKVNPKEMPQKLIIVSDMQFDAACKSNTRSNFEQIKKLYRASRYTIPELVFWNAKSSDNVPMTVHDTGTCLVSGCSPSILKSVLTGKVITPIDVMMETLYSDRYDPIGQLF